jgi:hypothetical protein
MTSRQGLVKMFDEDLVRASDQGSVRSKDVS